MYAMIECVGVLSCSDDGQCSIQCGGSFCSPEEEQFECLANPCEVDTCDEPYVSCASSFCGGCNSHFFNSAGEEVCTVPRIEEFGQSSQVTTSPQSSGNGSGQSSQETNSPTPDEDGSSGILSYYNPSNLHIVEFIFFLLSLEIIF